MLKEGEKMLKEGEKMIKAVTHLSLEVDIVRISHCDKVNWTLKNTLP